MPSLVKGFFLRRFVILLLLVLLAIKVGAVLARGPVAIEMDAAGYWRLSSLVMSGDLLMFAEPIAYRTPGYPYFLALIRFLSGPWALPIIVATQGTLAVITVWIAGRIAVSITNLPRAMPLTLLASLPTLSSLTFGAAVLSETLFVFLMMLNLWAMTGYTRYGTKWSAGWVGVTFALTLLTRPIVLLLWVPHVVYLLLVHHHRWRRLRGTKTPGRVKLHHRLGHGLLAAGIIAVICVPWLIRNTVLFGTPKLTEFVGRNVWIVTFQDGSGAGLDLPGGAASEQLQRRLGYVNASEGWRHTWTVSNALVASGLNDAQADRLMKQVSVDAISNNRELFAWKAFRRVVNFWRCAATDLPQQAAIGNYRRQWTWSAKIPPIDWAIRYRFSQYVWGNTLLTVIIAAAVVLLIYNAPTRPHGLWSLMILGYFAVVTGVLEIPAYRYRLVIEPVAALTIGSACAVALSWRRKTAMPEVTK